MDQLQVKPTCKRCDVTFATSYSLDKHLKKKFPCDKKIKCDKCKKEFSRQSHLTAHESRKIPCDPIIGNMLVDIAEGRCRFCGKCFKNKYTLKNHYNTCKIKNGGMDTLFDILRCQQDQIKMLICANSGVTSIEGNQNIVGGSYNTIKNHFNTTINIPLVCFGGEAEYGCMRTIIAENVEILQRPMEPDVSRQEQLCNRIGDFVSAIYRNPSHKDLQIVYTKHGFSEMCGDNAFTFAEGRWHIGDWDKISRTILARIYNTFLDIRRSIKNRSDVLQIMGTIFVAAGLGSPAELKITDENLQELYCEIGRRLGFATLVLE